jgi:hypothetical protein
VVPHLLEEAKPSPQKEGLHGVGRPNGLVSRNVQSVLKTSVLSVGRRRAFSAGRTNVYSAGRKDVRCFSVTSKERCLVSGKEECLICGPEDSRKERCSLNILPSSFVAEHGSDTCMAKHITQEEGLLSISYNG